MIRNWSRWAVALLTIVATWGVVPQNAAAQFLNGELYFGQGLPGTDLGQPNSFPVDVCVGINGSGALNCVFSGVRFGNFRGPLSLAPGVYQVTVAPANTLNPGTNAPILSGTVGIRARQSFTFMAHLTTNGQPAGTAFQNDVDRIVLGRSRVTTRHIADNGPIDVSLLSLVGMPGKAALGLTNPTQSAPADLVSGPFLVTTTPAGVPGIQLVSPFNLTLVPSNAYYLYVVGSTDNGTLQVLVQTLPLRLRLFP